MSGTALGLAPSDPLAGRIRQSMEDHDRSAEKLQGKRVTVGWIATVVSPAAVGLLAWQVVFQPRRSWSGVLIGIEVLIVVSALVISYWRMMGWPHKEWIGQRLRAEILRREEFLFRARVGPYLKQPISSLEGRVIQRLQRIDSDVREPIELVPMKEKEGGDKSWREALEDARHDGSLPAVPDLLANLGPYLSDRVEYQRNWFSVHSKSYAKSTLHYEESVKAVLVAAVLVALAHLVLLLVKGTDSLYSEVCVFFAICLPAIGAMLVGMESLLETNRLSRSYAYHSKVLEDFKERLITLNGSLCLPQADRGKLQFEFMRIVLEVEDMFSSELQHWWFLMQPNVPSPSA